MHSHMQYTICEETRYENVIYKTHAINFHLFTSCACLRVISAIYRYIRMYALEIDIILNDCSF